MSQTKLPPRATQTFLGTFNAIDRELRKRTRMHRNVPFTRVLSSAIDKDPTLASVADRLELFKELRNVIVHNGTDLAEPMANTVRSIKQIHRTVTKPPKLAPMFLRPTVVCAPDDPMGEVARRMASEDFSQLPVYDQTGLLKGMITTAAVARWLGSHTDGAPDLATPIADVMKHEEYPGAYLVFKTNETVGKALAAFKAASEKGLPLYGIVLTVNGGHKAEPEGIVTLSDVPRLWQAAA